MFVCVNFLVMVKFVGHIHSVILNWSSDYSSYNIYLKLQKIETYSGIINFWSDPVSASLNLKFKTFFKALPYSPSPFIFLSDNMEAVKPVFTLYINNKYFFFK